MNPVPKYFALLFCCLLYLSHTLAQECNQAIVDWPGGRLPCDTSAYTLVFFDEFNDGKFDTSKWYSYYPFGPDKSDQCEFCRTHGDGEEQLYVEENLQFTDSTLKLVARKQDTTWFGAQRSYTSGMINSKQHFKYGKYEIRCKIPKGRGLWPAFWMWGGDECDVFEFCGHKPKLLKSNLHLNCDDRHFMTSGKHKGPNYSKDFHVISVEWEPQYVVWRVDGKIIQTIHTYRRSKKQKVNCGDYVPEGTLIQNKLVPDQYMQVIANLALCKRGGYCKRKGINRKTPFPAVFEIDYIRVYQKKKDVIMLD